MIVSENFFRVLGVQPMPGRGFLPEDGQASGRNAVVVLDYGTWNDQFDRSTSIVGSNVRINGIDFSVVGVTPESFKSLDERMRPAFYVPSTMSQRLNAVRDDPLEDNRDHSWLVKGRLKTEIPQTAAQAELTTMWADIERRSPELDRSRQLAVQSELQARAGGRPDAILVPLLMVLVGLVLVIACANVANLLLGRASARSREIALRLALGVTRVRLFRHLLIESLLLSLVAAVVGLLFAYVGIRSFQMMPLTDVSVVSSPELDRRVLGVCLLAAMASTLFFGLAPAWRSARAGLASTLKSGETSAGGRPRTIGRNVLVVSQIALIEPLRNLVHSIDVDQPVYNVQSFSSFYEKRAVRVPLMILQTVAAMGVMGIALALVGIYALVSYSVARRTRDIGVRMAIGADRLSVLKMVLGQGLVLSTLGITIGGCSASVSLAYSRLD